MATIFIDDSKPFPVISNQPDNRHESAQEFFKRQAAGLKLISNEMEQENNEVSYGITHLYSGTVNKSNFSDWSDGINDSWPYGWKYFPKELKFWDNLETLIDMVKGDKIVNIIDKELKGILDNHLIENLDRDIRNIE